MSNQNIALKAPTRNDELYQNEAKHIKAMTLEELRASGQFQNHTDSELASMIDTLRTFTEIVYSAWSKQREAPHQASATIIPLDSPQRKAA